MDHVLQRVLRSFIQRGTLRLTTARGTTWEFGDGSGKPVVVRFTTPAAERAVLLLGMYELIHRLDVPYRVVVNEAVELTKQFGATDGYKYINALLDRAARDIRANERQQSRH